MRLSRLILVKEKGERAWILLIYPYTTMTVHDHRLAQYYNPRYV